MIRASMSLDRLDEPQDTLVSLCAVRNKIVAKREAVIALGAERRCQALRDAADLLLNEPHEVSQFLTHHLFPSVGLSQEMTRQVFRDALSSLTNCDLEGSLTPQLGIRAGYHISRPECCHIILAGNVFTACLQPFAMALGVGIPIICKPASEQWAFPWLFRRALQHVEPDLAEALGIVTFSRNDVEMMDAFLDSAMLAVVYGGDDTIRMVRRKAPATCRLVEHGHGISLAYLDQHSLHDRTLAKELALDIAAYDQHGCLSPQVVWLEAGAPAAHKYEFLTSLHEELSRLEMLLPRGPLDEGAAAAQMQWRGVAVCIAQLFEASAHAIAYSPNGDLDSGPGFRNILVCDCAGPEEFTRLIAPYGAHLKQVGLACSPQVARQILETLAPNQSPRLCPVGQMQKPPFTGYTEGLHPASSFVKWVHMQDGSPAIL